MKNNKIWISTEYYYPEYDAASGYFMTGIAESLAKYSKNVSVLCASKNEVDGKNIYREIRNNVEIFRINKVSDKFNKNNLIQRIFKFVIISLKFFYFLFKKVKKNDTLIIVTNPAPLIIISTLIKKLKKCNLIICVHDVFPENLVALNLTKSNSLFYKIVLRLFNYSYSTANLLITCGRDMNDLFKNKINSGTKIKFIPNWADTNMISNNKDLGLEILNKFNICNKLVFQFSGNFGRAQGINELLNAACLLKDKRAHFLFFGKGVHKEKIANTIAHNVTYGGTYLRKDSNIYINACDIAIVSLCKGMKGLGVPSKVYNNLAAGKPILYVGEENSEIAMMIKEYNVGIHVIPDSKEILSGVHKFLTMDPNELNQMSSRARLVAEKKYAKHTILDKYNKLVLSY
tara:strand:+ start:1149 stop:2354 length:1206 start_codon:yes stop_codon:yes gene_type:complete